jgi:hypothetical protein
MDKSNNSSSMSQLLTLFAIVWAGGLSLSEEQIASITQILVSAMTPKGSKKPMDTSAPAVASSGTGETVRGMNELAQLLGVSMPTACKLSKSGKFDEARLNFGTKKFVWDRAKLLAIATRKDE